MAEETKTTNDLQAALRQAAASLAHQISEATALEVKTLWVEVSDDGAYKFEDARPVASTRIELDGDTTLTIPMRRENGVLVRDDDLLELHLGSVSNAVEYRYKILDAILNVVRQVRTR